MVKFSEISDDGSNGGDPNKKPQEEENQNEKPKQQVQNLPIPQDLPEHLIESILARIPRDRYPNLSLTSKAFRDIITSPRLFEARSQLGRTECVLYAFIGSPLFDFPRWYFLHRRNNSLRLSIINSLPPMIPGSAVVTIGHEMYIFGGKLISEPPVCNVFVIDCRFHTRRSLPDMRRARHDAAAGVIDGKIYVIGGCIELGGDWIEVFDVNNQIWGTVPDPIPDTVSFDGVFAEYVVMEEKIYIFDRDCCLAYEPRRGKWETWWSFWLGSSSCVVDDMWYSIDSLCSLGYPIVVYDPKDVVRRPVKGVRLSDLDNVVRRPVTGVRMSDLDNLDYHDESKMANFGGKLVILGRSQSQNSCDYNRERDIGA